MKYRDVFVLEISETNYYRQDREEILKTVGLGIREHRANRWNEAANANSTLGNVDNDRKGSWMLKKLFLEDISYISPISF